MNMPKEHILGSPSPGHSRTLQQDLSPQGQAEESPQLKGCDFLEESLFLFSEGSQTVALKSSSACLLVWGVTHKSTGSGPAASPQGPLQHESQLPNADRWTSGHSQPRCRSGILLFCLGLLDFLFRFLFILTYAHECFACMYLVCD